MKKGNTYCKGKKETQEPKQKISEESIQKIKEKNKGRLPPNTTKISIDGNIYISMTEA